MAVCGLTVLAMVACTSEEEQQNEQKAETTETAQQDASAEAVTTEENNVDTPPADEMITEEVEIRPAAPSTEQEIPIAKVAEEVPAPDPIPTEAATEVPAIEAASTETPVVEETSSEAPATTESTTRADINKLVVYGLAQHLASPNSPINTQVKELLRLLEQQYNEEKEQMTGTFERARMAFIIAEMRRKYTAWAAAVKDYDRAYEDYMAMPEELQKDPAAMPTLSAIYLGKALCYQAMKDTSKALENYNNRLKNDYIRGGHMTEQKSRITQFEAQAAADLISSMRTKAECLALIDQEQSATEFANAVAEADKLLWCPLMSIQNEYEQLIVSAAQQRLNNQDKTKASEYLTKLMQRAEALRNGAKNDSTREYFARKAKSLQDIITQIQTSDEKPAIEEVAPAPAEQPVVVQEPQKKIATPKPQQKKNTTSGKNKKKK